MNNKKTLRYLPLITCLICILLIAGIGLAAFAISGYRKGVAVANSYFFRSNVLTDIDDISDAENKVFTTVETNLQTTVDVKIMNYYNGQVNGFNVDYKIYYKLVGGTAGTYNYSIYYKDRDNTDKSVTLSTSNDFTQLGDTFTLNSSEKAGDKQIFNVVFTKPDNTYVPSQAASVVMYAVPVSPEYMVNFMLGGRIRLSETDAEFSVNGNFDQRIDSSTIDDMAGFMYYISTSGKIAEGESPRINITWDASKLEFDKQSKYIGDVIINVDADNNPTSGTLTLEVGTGEYIPIAFYRRNGTNITDAELSGLVSVEEVVGP